MNRTHFLIALLALTVAVAPVLGSTSRQYRGPANENPKGVAGPGNGLLGTARLNSKSRQVEGEGRWEFWWEINRDRFLRKALEQSGRQLAGDATITDPALAGPQPRMVSRDDVRKRVVPVLLARLESRDGEERILAALALGKAHVPEGFGPLRKMLMNRDGGDRRAAALALGFMGEPLAAPALIEFIGKRGISPAERSYGALALGFLGTEEAAPALRAALLESLAYRGRAIEEFQSSAISALGMLADKSSVPSLRRILKTSANRSAMVRTAAAVALGRIGDGAALSALMAGVGDSQVEVRRASVQGLGILGDVLAKPVLAKAFEKDGDSQVRSLAAISLAELGGGGTGGILLTGLDKKNPRSLQAYSALALGILGDKTAVKELRVHLGRKDEASLRSASAVALALLGDLGSVDALRTIVADEREDDNLRGYAVQALAMLSDPVTRARLSDLASESGSTNVRRSATLSLGLYRTMPAGAAVLRSLLSETDAHVRGAAVGALALHPRADVLDELLNAANAPGVVSDTRKDALAALGALAMEGRPSPAEKMLEHLNHRSMSQAVSDVVFLF